MAEHAASAERVITDGWDKPSLRVRALNEGFVVWRDADGQPGVLTDRCAHRAAKLSVGRILDGDLQCAFHGLRYNPRGECVLVPWEAENSPALNEINVQAYPAQELGGYIWAYSEPARGTVFKIYLPQAEGEASAIEHQRTMESLKRELGRLVVDTTAKVAGKILTPEDQRRLQEEAARQVA